MLKLMGCSLQHYAVSESLQQTVCPMHSKSSTNKAHAACMQQLHPLSMLCAMRAIHSFFISVVPLLKSKYVCNAQAFGDWSDEEHKLFLDTAQKHGVGDKWGLFASYIPQRVGYQCSAYYRDVIIPACLILDPRFKLSPQGKAVFAG